MSEPNTLVAINWLFDDEEVLFGHGCVLWHDRIGRNHCVASIDGYEWLPTHQTGRPATVWIRLTPPLADPPLRLQEWTRVVAEVVATVCWLLRPRQPLPQEGDFMKYLDGVRFGNVVVHGGF